MCDFLWCHRASMERTVEQRYAVKFCFKLGKSVSETFELIKQAYGDDALSYTRFELRMGETSPETIVFR